MKGIEGFSLGFLTFPTISKVIKKFEQKWPVSINFYGYSRIIYPHYLSSILLQSDRQVVNLLLHSGHYLLIRNMSTLVTPQGITNKWKCHVFLLVSRILFERTGMKLIFVCARKMGLSMFSLKMHSLFKSICRSGANLEKVLRIRRGAMQVYHQNQ